MTPQPPPDDLADAARRVNDPGGSHAKGYSADPDEKGVDVPADGPLPLSDAPPGVIHVPERDPGVQPTGRTDPDPSERILSGGH